MSITIERAVEVSPEVCDLIGELNDVLGAAYESHQRHGLSIVRFHSVSTAGRAIRSV